MATFGWFIYAWTIQEALFLHVFYVGLELFLISEILLVSILNKTRTKMEKHQFLECREWIVRAWNRSVLFIKQRLRDQKAG